MSTVTGTVGVGVAIPVTVVTSGPLNLVAIMKSTNSHLDRGGRHTKPVLWDNFTAFKGLTQIILSLCYKEGKNETSRPYNTKNPYYERNGLGVLKGPTHMMFY